ncbi:MAG: copper resistance protein B [Gammaproteobacteria bacterium]|nr:copper resistance protein B [Gammaproteobacteria bacterium]
MRRRLSTHPCLFLSMLVVLLSVSVQAQEKNPIFHGVNFEQLEYRFGDDTDVVAWDADALVGTDEWKFRIQSKAEYETRPDIFETLEHQFLVQRLWSDFFDLKAGIRLDMPKGPDRVYGVIGIQGLAPQWFEIDADLFVSENAAVSARLDSNYELLITNHWILTPTVEVDVGFSDDEEIGLGAGLRKAEAGLRLSYDLVDRSVAPYVGIHYMHLFGETRQLARNDGEATEDLFLTAGVRLRF